MHVKKDEKVTKMQRSIMLRLCSFHRCPNNGEVLEADKTDDKVFCDCGKQNPRASREDVKGRVVLHLKSLLASATVDEFIKQVELQNGLT